MARPRKSDVPSELSPSPVEAAPRKRGRPRKTETVKAAQSVATPEIKKSQKIEKIAKVSKVRKPAKVKTPPDTKIDGIADGVAPEPAPKKKRGAPKGNQNAKGNKGIPGNKFALGNKGGRPPSFPVTPEIITQIKRLSSFACTQREAACYFEIEEDAFEGVLRTNKKAREAWETGGGKFNCSLRRKQAELAMSGNVPLLIFLGKNRLGQKDKVEHP